MWFSVVRWHKRIGRCIWWHGWRWWAWYGSVQPRWVCCMGIGNIYNVGIGLVAPGLKIPPLGHVAIFWPAVRGVKTIGVEPVTSSKPVALGLGSTRVGACGLRIPLLGLAAVCGSTVCGLKTPIVEPIAASELAAFGLESTWVGPCAPSSSGLDTLGTRESVNGGIRNGLVRSLHGRRASINLKRSRWARHHGLICTCYPLIKGSQISNKVSGWK